MLPFLAKIFSGGSGTLVKSIGDVIDNLVTSKEEREQLRQAITQEINRSTEKMAEIANAETEIYFKDVQSARDTNAKIQEADKASWLAKNVGYILDLSVATLFYFMLILIFFVGIPSENKEIFYTAFGILGAKYGSSFDFHRGSSVGSKASGDALRKFVNSK